MLVYFCLPNSSEAHMQQKRTWWQDGVIYQIYPRSFSDSNGDGIGDLRGVINKLDHLGGTPDSLAIDAIWLSPFFPSPNDDFGYDVSDYKNVDPQYGNMSDIDELIEKCKARNIKVMLDIVVNHTSSQHAWFREAISSKTNPKRDWYIWAKGKNGKPPNNWQSRFGGSSWEYDKASDEYYLHSFLASQPDLNWRNPEVRKAVLDVFKFWLDKGVKGFRLDVFNFYFKDDQLRNNPPKLSFAGLLYGYDRQHHVYDKDRPELYEAVREIRKLVDSYDECVLLGEVDSDKNTEAAALCYGQNNDGLHLVFNFDFLQCAWKAKAFRKVISQWDAAVPNGAWPTYVLSNHDQPRHHTRFGNNEARSRVAAALLLTLRGTPVMYYGEEIGMPESYIRPQLLQDPPGKKWWPLYLGRDGCRTPMQWTSGYNAGFSTSPETWLPVDESYLETNLEKQQTEKNASLLSLYRQLLAIRKSSAALREGVFELFDCGAKNVLSYTRQSAFERVLVLLNFENKPVAVDLKFPWQILYGQLERDAREKTVMSAYGILILKM